MLDHRVSGSEKRAMPTAWGRARRSLLEAPVLRQTRPVRAQYSMPERTRAQPVMPPVRAAAPGAVTCGQMYRGACVQRAISRRHSNARERAPSNPDGRSAAMICDTTLQHGIVASPHWPMQPPSCLFFADRNRMASACRAQQAHTQAAARSTRPVPGSPPHTSPTVSSHNRRVRPTLFGAAAARVVANCALMRPCFFAPLQEITACPA